MKMYSILTRLRFPVIFISFIVLAIRLFVFINRYAVNLMFWDQWDNFVPVFKNLSFWALFTQPNGPIRLGIGLVITKFWMQLSGWNTRVDSFAIGVVVCLAATGALGLKRRLTGAWSWTDVIIPLSMLTLSQYESFTGTPNVSHGALPVLLAVLMVFGWLIRNKLIRTGVILVLTFLSIFTGFGLFLGVITPVVFIIDIYHQWRQKAVKPAAISSAGLVGTIISWSIFAVGYKFNSAVSCFSISLRSTIKYPVFMSIMEANFFQIDYQSVSYAAIAFGAVIVLALLAASIHSLVKVIRAGLETNNGLNLAAFILMGYTLLYLLGTAIGRSCLGMASAEASRYMTITSLGFVGLYLYLSGLAVSWHKVATWALAAFLCLTLLPLGSKDQKIYRDFYYQGKTAWKACYLQKENLALCSAETHFLVYPDTNSAWVKEALAYLKANHLNLYLDDHP